MRVTGRIVLASVLVVTPIIGGCAGPGSSPSPSEARVSSPSPASSVRPSSAPPAPASPAASSSPAPSAVASAVCAALAGPFRDYLLAATGAAMLGENEALPTRQAIDELRAAAAGAADPGEEHDLTALADAMEPAAMSGDGYLGWSDAYEAFYVKYAEGCGLEIAN